MDKKETGYYGENAVCDYLIRKGYRIIKQNYCIKGGEIDIISQKDDIIAFTEVKTRSISCIESGFSAINIRKQKKIVQAALKFILTAQNNQQPRFDAAQVVLDGKMIISIDYIENAFDTTEMNIIY